MKDKGKITVINREDTPEVRAALNPERVEDEKGDLFEKAEKPIKEN